ncbi:MAG: 50S ribosomal protein L14 [Puniceicoccales bacterium]|jgi:large subunit ribosomal protein L14|nr:50S ribosomal protein L14 [Puniceicoccales bacterium]
MIQQESVIDVADNTGARSVLMIRRLGQNKRTATVGDTIVVTVKSSTPEANVKKGTVAKAVVVRTRHWIHRPGGDSLRFDGNACVLIDDKGGPRGTRVFGAIAKEVRRGFPKIASLAQEVL